MTHVEYAVFFGGPDPDNAAGVRIYPDRATAEEDVQFLSDSGIARRWVSYGPWEILAAADAADGRARKVYDALMRVHAALVAQSNDTLWDARTRELAEYLANCSGDAAELVAETFGLEGDDD